MNNHIVWDVVNNTYEIVHNILTGKIVFIDNDLSKKIPIRKRELLDNGYEFQYDGYTFVIYSTIFGFNYYMDDGINKIYGLKKNKLGYETEQEMKKKLLNNKS